MGLQLPSMMKMKLAWRLLAALPLLLAFAGPSSASIQQALEIEEMTDLADEVVVVEALDAQPRWDAFGRIVTDVRLRVSEGMKGSLGVEDEAMATFLGGAIDGVGMRVEGSPSLAPGDRALFFARDRDSMVGAVLRPVGMSQGVLPVRRAGGLDMVHPGGRGLMLVQRSSRGLLPAPGALPEARPLDELRRRIRARVEASR